MVKISGFIVASVLYCTAVYFTCVFLNNHTFFFPDQQQAKSETSYYSVPVHQKSFALPLKIQFTAQSPWFDTYTFFSNKIPAGVINVIEQTCSKSINRYVFQSFNIPVRLRKKDIIFPFHYFW
jgi:hypothetical protein